MQHTAILIVACLITGVSSSAIAQCPDGFITSDQNLIRNGDFANGSVDIESDYQYSESFEGKSTFLDEGFYAVTTDPSYAHPYFARCGDRRLAGTAMMIINGSWVENQKVWKQSVRVKPSTTYYFSTWICNLVPAAPSDLAFSINNVALGESIVAPLDVCTWRQFFAVWNSGSATEAEICIVNRNLTPQGNDFSLDDIVFYECEEQKILEPAFADTVGATITLRNVFFDVAKSELKEESFVELNVLYSMLQDRPKLVIQIAGHTDDVGSDSDNLTLSRDRAKAVYNYLIAKGITASRLSFEGYGESRPIDSNETLEGRQKNRRVEFSVQKR